MVDVDFSPQTSLTRRVIVQRLIARKVLQGTLRKPSPGRDTPRSLIVRVAITRPSRRAADADVGRSAASMAGALSVRCTPAPVRYRASGARTGAIRAGPMRRIIICEC